MSQRVRFAALATVVVVLLTAAATSAQPVEASSPIQVDEANRLFREGREDFNEGRIKDALRKYRTAWKIRRSPDVAANLAQAELELGQLDQAATHFAFALAYLLPSTSREQRVALEQALTELRKQVGEIDLRVEPAQAQVTIDGNEVDPSFLEPGVFVQSGGHVVRAAAEGYRSVERNVAVAEGQSIALVLRLEPLPEANLIEVESASAAPNPTGEQGTETERRPGRTAAIVAGSGFAVVGLSVGAVFTARAAGQKRDADTLRETAIVEVGEGNCAGQTAGPCVNLRDTLDQQGRSRNVAVGGFVAGGVFAVATVVTALAWPKAGVSSARRVSVGVGGGSHDAWLSVGARF